MRPRRWLVYFMLVITACDPGPSRLVVTSLRCLDRRGGGFEWLGIDVGSKGPSKCWSVLVEFLKLHPSRRIASILPVEYRPTPQADLQIEHGTQELIIVHTIAGGTGPWPRASDLTLSLVRCDQACALALGTLSPNTRLWAPITSRRDAKTTILVGSHD